VQGDGIQGQLEFKDHDAQIDVKSVAMHWVYSPNQGVGYFIGSCRLNGETGYTFFVEVHDLGQPGSNDTISIRVVNSFDTPVYIGGGTLAGGNIVIHGN